METSQVQQVQSPRRNLIRRQLKFKTNFIPQQKPQQELIVQQQPEKSKISLPQLKKLDVGLEPLTVKGNQVRKMPALNFERFNDKNIFERSNVKQFSFMEPRMMHIKLDPIKKSYGELDQEKEIIFDMKTKAGQTLNRKTKRNQDSAIVNHKALEILGFNFFGVCDGHGANGHLVSNFIAKKLPDCLAKEISSNQLTVSSFEKAFSQTNSDLWNSEIDCNLSGTTTVTVMITKEKIWSANVGDSRAILCKEHLNSQWEAIPLTSDHKPDNPDENMRIINNGEVQYLKINDLKDLKGNPVGPLRVWLAKADGPGLAMTRSLGDKIGCQAGIIGEPEVREFSRSKEDRFVIIASDGVWEYLTNDEVMDIVRPFYKSKMAEQGCERVVQEAVSSWRFSRDDITCVVVFFRDKESSFQ